MPEGDWSRERSEFIAAEVRRRTKRAWRDRWSGEQDRREQQRFISIAKRTRRLVPYSERIYQQVVEGRRISKAQARVLLQIEQEHPRAKP